MSINHDNCEWSCGSTECTAQQRREVMSEPTLVERLKRRSWGSDSLEQEAIDRIEELTTEIKHRDTRIVGLQDRLMKIGYDKNGNPI
jgi:hypothetical protein